MTITSIPCYNCKGTGNIGDKKCRRCSGTGRVVVLVEILEPPPSTEEKKDDPKKGKC